jgi:hypothetical protein
MGHGFHCKLWNHQRLALNSSDGMGYTTAKARAIPVRKWFEMGWSFHKCGYFMLFHVYFTDLLYNIWVWVNTYRYIFSGMNIHLPAFLGFTRYQGFDPSSSYNWYFDVFRNFGPCFPRPIVAALKSGATSQTSSSHHRCPGHFFRTLGTWKCWENPFKSIILSMKIAMLGYPVDLHEGIF